MDRESQIRVLCGAADVRIFSNGFEQATRQECQLMSELFKRIAIEATLVTERVEGVTFCFPQQGNIGRKLIKTLGMDFGTVLSMLVIDDQLPQISMNDTSMVFLPHNIPPEDTEDHSRDMLFIIVPDDCEYVNGSMTVTEFING